MKTRRTNRFTALVLAIVMLASLVTLPVFAEEETEKEPKVFANVDFEDAAVNKVTTAPPEGSPEGTVGPEVDGTSITASGIASAHTYVSIGEDEEHGKYAIIPFRGKTDDGKTGSGNFDTTFAVQHPEVSYATTQGVNFEFDIYTSYVAIEGQADPTVEFQFRSVNHDPIGTSTSSAFISFGMLNLRTGEFSTSAIKTKDAVGVKLNEWNKIRFELDLANATFSIYINDVKYAAYGTIGNNNVPTNIIVPAGTLLIAKCNKNKGAYNDDETVADTDMTYVAIDNIKFYENVDFVPPAVEEKPQYSLFYDSYQSKTPGTTPREFGYPTMPSTAVVAVDPTDESNNAIRVDLTACGEADYYLWHSGNYYQKPIAANADYDPEDPMKPKYNIDENGNLTATTELGTFTAPIWGDDPDETGGKESIPATYRIQENGQDKVGTHTTSGYYYFLTGAMCDAFYGASNVGHGLNVKHNAILSSENDTVVLNVDYYFSEDATGTIEIQLQGYFAKKENPSDLSALAWLDTVQISATADNDTLSIKPGSNNVLVCGSAPTLKKGEWFTMSVIFDMETGWEDIYFNGSYCYTTSPKDSYKFGSTNVPISEIQFHSIGRQTLNVGKIVRNTTPGALNGYFMVDNVNFSTGEVLLGEQYEKTFVQNFDDLDPSMTDFSDTEFGNGIPSSVVLAGDDTHTSALKLAIGEKIEDEALAEAPVLYRTGKSANDTMYKVAKVYDDYSVLLARDLADGAEAPETAPETVFKRSSRGQYKVDDVNGYILGTYRDYVNYWAKLEDGSAATNVDKQWIFHNPGVSYAIKDRVATDVEIFIPEGASGIVSAQITKGAGTDASGKKANFTYKDLYCIDLATGNVNLGAGVSDEEDEHLGTLKIGEWNTVSFAINMVTGTTELYVNNVYAGEGSFGYTQVAFYESSWILAKVARMQDQKEHPLAGEIMLDDARFFTVTNQLITVDSNLENVVEVSFAGETVADGTKLFITDDVRCTCDPSAEEENPCGLYYEKKFDTSAYLDVVYEAYTWDYLVSVRSNAPIGLRFTTSVDLDILDELLAEFDGEVTYGTVIVPSSAVATMNEITRPELNLRGIEYLEIRTDSFFSNEYLEEEWDYDFEGEGVFAGSIVGLRENNLSRDFSAVGYVEIALASGGSIVIYTEEMNANLKDLAQQYLDEIDEIPDDIRTVLDAFAIGRYPQGYNDGLRSDS